MQSEKGVIFLCALMVFFSSFPVLAEVDKINHYHFDSRVLRENAYKGLSESELVAKNGQPAKQREMKRGEMVGAFWARS